MKNSESWLARQLEPERKLFPDHLSFILYGALVDVGSLWPNFHLSCERV
jgi:hypothetical protein